MKPSAGGVAAVRYPERVKLRFREHDVSLAGVHDIAPGAAVIGRLVAGDGLVLRPFATLRADGESITVGRNGWFGERASVHIVDGVLSTTIGGEPLYCALGSEDLCR